MQILALTEIIYFKGFLMKNFVVFAIFMAFFSGCALVSDSPNQIVRLEASDGKKLVVNITTTMKGGLWGLSSSTKTFKATLPTEVPISRSNGATITILDSDNPGYKSSEFVINGKDSVNPWYFGNIIFGGLYGLTTTDPISGSMWRYSNPNFVIPVNKK